MLKVALSGSAKGFWDALVPRGSIFTLELSLDIHQSTGANGSGLSVQLERFVFVAMSAQIIDGGAVYFLRFIRRSSFVPIFVVLTVKAKMLVFT